MHWATRMTVLKHKLAQSVVLTDLLKIMKFNPNQPRNELGEWTAEGGGSAQHHTDTDVGTPHPRSTGPHGTPEMQAEASARAEVLRDRAMQAESRVTSDLKALVSNGEMIGVQHAVKGQASLARKIEVDAIEDQLSVEDSARFIGDSLRYTAQFEPKDYNAGTKAMIEGLIAKGYHLIGFRNTWQKQGEDTPIYQGINTNFMTPDGHIIELQFHTPGSFYMKHDTNHAMYEEWRDHGTPDNRKDELYAMMQVNQAHVEQPIGVSGVKVAPTREWT